MYTIRNASLILVSAMFLLSTACNTASEIEDPPNILFCIADDASYPFMSAYGCNWIQTPAFDRIAEEGILFDNAYTPNAKCAPSRSCIITGMNSWQLGEAANHWPYFPAEFVSVVEVLDSAGYHTGFTGKGWAPGIAGKLNGRARHLTGKPYNQIRKTPPTKQISDIDYSENFKAFMDEREKGQPWFFWYGGKEPHRAYTYGSGAGVGGMEPNSLDSVPGFWPDNEVTRNDLLDYSFEVQYFDQELAEILGELEASGELENTLVIVTSDNGMPFPRIKGQEYELSNHLPLAIMWKKGISEPGRSVDDLISFIDFAPTFLEISGASIDSAQQSLPGKSMVQLFSTEGRERDWTPREYVLIGKERHDVGRPDDVGYPIRGIIRDDYLFLRNFKPDRWPAGNPVTGYLNCDGSPTKTEILNMNRHDSSSWYWEKNFGKRPGRELYNIQADPLCLNNLANDPAYTDLANMMETIMTTNLREQGDPRILGNGSIFDNYTYADKSTRNFYNRYINGEDLPAGWVNPSDFEHFDPE